MAREKIKPSKARASVATRKRWAELPCLGVGH